MKRRRLLPGLAGLLGGGASGWAQAPRPPGRIGYLHPRTVAADHPTLRLLQQAWRALGYVEGETVLLRSAGDDPRRLPALVEELIALQVGVLIVVGAEAVRAAARTTRTVPIVAIDLETDPVRAGLAASFARPSGNVTGLFLDQPSLAGKWIDLLREAAPGLERIALLWDPGTGRDQLAVAQAVLRDKGLVATLLELKPRSAIDASLRALTTGRQRTGIVQLSSPGFVVVATEYAEAARRHGLPMISFLKSYAQAGVLMTYGPVQSYYFPRAVALADKILRGERAAELPIEGPDRFELVINGRTAKALGLTIPQSLLLRTDEVIE